MGDCTGSKKQYSFRLTAENTGEVHLFECAIDLLSYATLMKLEGKDWRQFNLVSLAGVYSPKQKIEDSKVPVTLGRLLEKDKTIRRIVLHLDNDIAGRKATKALQTILSDKYEVVDDPPQYGKDVNDFLCKRLGKAVCDYSFRHRYYPGRMAGTSDCTLCKRRIAGNTAEPINSVQRTISY